jgi:hypothetical protein
MGQYHSLEDVLLVSFLYMLPSILAFMLVWSVPMTVVVVVTVLAALVRRAPTERWFGRLGLA